MIAPIISSIIVGVCIKVIWNIVRNDRANGIIERNKDYFMEKCKPFGILKTCRSPYEVTYLLLPEDIEIIEGLPGRKVLPLLQKGRYEELRSLSIDKVERDKQAKQRKIDKERGLL